MDFEAAADVAWRVYELAPSVPGRLTDKRLIFLRDFPSGSCDSMAYATGVTLLEQELGDWWIVTNSEPGCRHVWLEWRDTDGEVLFSIDATAHQFAEIDKPFVGHGRTPSAERFTEEESAVRVSELSPNWPRDSDEALLAHVRAHLDG
jgi:hypothetical protein